MELFFYCYYMGDNIKNNTNNKNCNNGNNNIEQKENS